jgi:hypothetical protein
MVALLIPLTCGAAEIRWQRLSSKNGDLPVPPGGSVMQTGAVVGDFDGDGTNDFVLSFRQKPPALVWYRRLATGWDSYVIEKDYLTIEAGGAVYDLDGDGDLDSPAATGGQRSVENPSPEHLLEASPDQKARTSTTMVFGDFPAKPRLEPAGQDLFLADPRPPRRDGWPDGNRLDASASSTPTTEGMSRREVISSPRSCQAHGREQQIKLGDAASSSPVIRPQFPQIVIRPATAGQSRRVRRQREPAVAGA